MSLCQKAQNKKQIEKEQITLIKPDTKTTYFRYSGVLNNVQR